MTTQFTQRELVHHLFSQSMQRISKRAAICESATQLGVRFNSQSFKSTTQGLIGQLIKSTYITVVLAHLFWQKKTLADHSADRSEHSTDDPIKWIDLNLWRAKWKKQSLAVSHFVLYIWLCSTQSRVFMSNFKADAFFRRVKWFFIMFFIIGTVARNYSTEGDKQFNHPCESSKSCIGFKILRESSKRKRNWKGE